MFLVVLAVSDPLLLSVAALSTGAHLPRFYLIGGITGLSGEQAELPGSNLSSSHKKRRKGKYMKQPNFVLLSFSPPPPTFLRHFYFIFFRTFLKFNSVSSLTDMTDLMPFDWLHCCRVNQSRFFSPDYTLKCFILGVSSDVIASMSEVLSLKNTVEHLIWQEKHLKEYILLAQSSNSFNPKGTNISFQKPFSAAYIFPLTVLPLSPSSFLRSTLTSRKHYAYCLPNPQWKRIFPHLRE